MQYHTKKLRLYYELSKYFDNRPSRAVIFMSGDRRVLCPAAADIRAGYQPTTKGGQLMYYHTCPYCGANLDPDERCDCLSRIQGKAPKWSAMDGVRARNRKRSARART